jgi:hypothetical protein
MGLSPDTVNSVINAAVDQMEHKDVTLSIPFPIASSKPEQAGIIEYGSDGAPHITVSPEKLTAREVIGLLLYAKSTISMSELTQLVANNWRNVEMPYISSSLTKMRAYVIKEGLRGSYFYKLSGAGRNWIENELLPKLKSKA